MTAAPMRPPAIPEPQPPRHRASAGDGKARAVTPTMPAAISANAVLFMIVPFCFSKQTLTGAGGLGFDIRSHRKRAVSNLILVNGHIARLPNVAVSRPNIRAHRRWLSNRILREPTCNLRQIHRRQYEACHEDDR